MVDRLTSRRSDYSETDANELLPAAPDGKLHIRSRKVEGAADRWLARDLTAGASPGAFEQWVGHIRRGTTATENLELALDLTAVVEAAYRSAAGGRTVRPDSLERAG
jgi:predicted dehydrogenase